MAVLHLEPAFLKSAFCSTADCTQGRLCQARGRCASCQAGVPGRPVGGGWGPRVLPLGRVPRTPIRSFLLPASGIPHLCVGSNCLLPSAARAQAAAHGSVVSACVWLHQPRRRSERSAVGEICPVRSPWSRFSTPVLRRRVRPEDEREAALCAVCLRWPDGRTG